MLYLQNGYKNGNLKDDLTNKSRSPAPPVWVRHCCVLTVEAQRYSQQENGLSRLFLLLLPDKNRSGNSSQKQPCICAPPSAFLEEEIHSS